MSRECTYLFAISFLIGNESGLAVVSAPNELQAHTILKNQGKYNGTPERYQIEQTRNVGLYTQERCELILESYTNALVAFDAIVAFMLKHPVPTFTVEQVAAGVLVEATDENGTTSATLYHGEKGEPGAQGVGIQEILLNPDYTLTFKMSDGAVHDTGSVRGPEGPQGPRGIRGEQGEKGDSPVITADEEGNLYSDGKFLTDILVQYDHTKQDVIEDLDTIRAGAASGATAYQLPDGGIPASDMSSSVQTALGNAATAYQKPSGGIPASDIASGVIPTVPAISTDISADGASDTKTASPKAVKTYVDNNLPTVHDIPDGGTEGQVLAKKSGTDYDVEWVDQTGGGGGGDAHFKGGEAVSDIDIDDYAKKDGSYESMSVGLANNLEGDKIPVTDAYTTKPTAMKSNGEAEDVADGRAKMTELQGRAVAWNQGIAIKATDGSTTINEVTITDNRDGSYTVNGTASTIVIYQTSMTSLVAGHKYLLKGAPQGGGPTTFSIGNGSGYIQPDYADGTVSVSSNTLLNTTINIIIRKDYHADNLKFTPQLYDLTLLCPHLASQANLTVAQVEEYLATLMTPKPNFKVNTGTLLGSRMLGWSLRKTPNLLNLTTGKAELVEYTYTGHDNEYELTGWDNLVGAALQFTPYNTGVALSVAESGGDITIANGKFTIPAAGVLEVVNAVSGTDYTGDLVRVCVKMVWDDSKDGETYGFDEDSLEFDSANIYHKSGSTYSQVFDGGVMRATGDGADVVRDEMGYDEIAKKCWAKVKVEDQDLTNQRVIFRNIDTKNYLYWSISGAKYSAYHINSRYESVGNTAISTQPNLSITAIGGASNNIYFRDDSLTLASVDAQNHAAVLSGVHLWYELATPVVYTSDLYYKTGESTYVPLEEVWPLIGQCCNWATTSLTQQDFDNNSQPQSVVPMTKEIYMTDLKELLKTIGDTYVSEEDISGKENITNKVTSLSSSSTDTQYPSAKTTWDNIHPAVQTTQSAGGMLPNVMYSLGTLTGNVTFTLAAGTSGIVNHYYWTFDTTSTAPTVTWPSGITWVGGIAPTISASKHYEVSVLNEIAMIMEV